MMSFVNIPGNVDPILILSSSGTGAGTTTFTHNQGVEGNYPSQLYPAVFIFAITDIVGSFSSLQVNLEWSPITPDVGAAQFQTVGTWAPLTSPVIYFPCSASGIYRLNCTAFSGGTSFNVYVSIASTMPQGTGGGGGGGSVTQGTVPWIDNIADVAGVALGATAVVPYGSTPAAVNVPGVNAFITNAGSIGGGVQFADNAGSGATPTGTLAMGWDSVNSKIRAFKVDASQNHLVALGAALPAGTNVIGHVIVDSGAITVSGTVAATQSGTWNVNQAIGVAGFEKITDGTNTAAVKAASTAAAAADPALVVTLSPNSPLPAGTNVIGHVIVDSGAITVSGSVSVSNFPTNQNVVGTTTDGTTTETNFLVVGGESNDATAQYQPIPLGTTGRSVIIEGFAGGVAVPISGSVSVSNFPTTVDVTDRAARLVGVVYGSQGQQLKQTATNFNLQVELATGGTLYDARQIRALTSADIVTANQGAPNTLANRWPVQVTDGTNVMPTGDVIARALFHEITDGVNGPVAVKAASVAPLATDSALVVSISPNSTITTSSSLAPNAAQETGGNLTILSDLLKTLISEVRAMRTAIVYAVTENGEVSDQDFNPASADFQPVN